MSSSFAFGAALGAVCVCVSVTGCSGGDADNAVGGTGAGAAAGVGGAGAVGGQAGSGGSAGTGTGVGGATGGVGGASAGTGAFGGTGTAGTGGAAAGTGGSSGVGGGAGASAGSGSGSSGAGGVGMAGAGGSSGTSAEGGAGGGAAGSTGKAGSGGATSEHFSFFVTSLEAIRRESGSMDGFGGDLGGLSGADEICTAIAEASLPGAGAKGWHAFLSTLTVNAISRIGTGPWYDRLGHLVAMNVDGLLAERPAGDTLIVNDLPNELGQPNRSGTGTGMDDNHDTITGTNTDGEWDGGPTCDDWTSATGGDGPRVGHSWPANSGRNWMQAHPAPGCAPSVSLQQNGAGSGDGIGNGGGYGGFYCFAMMP